MMILCGGRGSVWRRCGGRRIFVTVIAVAADLFGGPAPSLTRGGGCHL
jgi:hypothetical protein